MVVRYPDNRRRIALLRGPAEELGWPALRTEIAARRTPVLATNRTGRNRRRRTNAESNSASSLPQPRLPMRDRVSLSGGVSVIAVTAALRSSRPAGPARRRD